MLEIEDNSRMPAILEIKLLVHKTPFKKEQYENATFQPTIQNIPRKKGETKCFLNP